MGVLVDLAEYRKAKDIQTVLIVDDDQILVSLLEEFIKSEFPEMAQLLAYNGIEALDQLSQRIPSLPDFRHVYAGVDRGGSIEEFESPGDISSPP